MTESILRPVAFLCYGVSVSTFALAKSLEKKGIKIVDIHDIRKSIEPVFQQIQMQTGVPLSIDWIPYEGLLTETNSDVYETTFIHTQWHTVTGHGFSHICLGEDIAAAQEEKTAIDLFCTLLELGKSLMDEMYKGYTLGTGTMENSK